MFDIVVERVADSDALERNARDIVEALGAFVMGRAEGALEVFGEPPSEFVRRHRRHSHHGPILLQPDALDSGARRSSQRASLGLSTSRRQSPTRLMATI